MKNNKSHKHDHNSFNHDHHHHNEKLFIALYFLGLILYIAQFFIKKDKSIEIFSLTITTNLIKNVILVISMVISGFHVITEGFLDTVRQTIAKKKFSPNVHILMTLAAIGAMLINEFSEGTLLILIFAGAHYLEDYAEDRSKREIENLIKLNPQTARKINEDGTLEIVKVESLVIGDKLRVLNGDQVPTDGVITLGVAAIDEASITGESIPKSKTVGQEVYGSTINGNSTFEMEVTKNNDETIFAKIVELVSQNQKNISKTAVLIKKIEPVYVTIVLLFAPVFYLLGQFVFGWDNSFYRTMVLLIGASPCALAATDIPATLSAISNIAKNGILFKGGSYLSNFADVDKIVFDKTGTITKGEPTVTDILFLKDYSEEEKELYTQIFYSLEKRSNHPLAKSVTNYFSNKKDLEIEVDNIIGSGVLGEYKGNEYFVGKLSYFEDKDIEKIKDEFKKFEDDGKTVIGFGTKKQVILLVAIQDIPRESSKNAIKYFNDLNIETIMITGDSQVTGNAISKQVGIKRVIGNVLPEDKSNIVNELKQNDSIVVMIGDGINDAPALVAADIGIAMGSGTDIAIDVADAVIMKNDLEKLTYIHKVSKRLKSIVIQNIFFALFIIIFLMIMNILDLMNMNIAVIVHETSTLIVILNGLRMLRKTK